MSYAGASQGSYAGRWQGRQSIPDPLVRLFDHGLGQPQRSIVQFGVVAMLQRLLIQNGGYLAAVIPTSTVIRGGGDDEGIGLVMDQLQGRAPAIAVATGVAEYKTGGDIDRWQKHVTVHLYVFTNNVRDRMSRVAGDVVAAANAAADPGAYVILEHCEQLLIGQGGDGTGSIADMRPHSETQLGGANTVELWEQVYGVWVSRAVNANRDLSLELAAINTYSRLATQAATDPAIVETDTVIKP